MLCSIWQCPHSTSGYSRYDSIVSVPISALWFKASFSEQQCQAVLVAFDDHYLHRQVVQLSRTDVQVEYFRGRPEPSGGTTRICRTISRWSLDRNTDHIGTIVAIPSLLNVEHRNATQYRKISDVLVLLSHDSRVLLVV